MPDRPPVPSLAVRRLTNGVVSFLAVASLLGAVAALAPSSTLRAAGTAVRRADDVTPERVVRFRSAAAVLSVGLLALALGVRRRRDGVAMFIAEAAQEFRGLPAEVARWWESLSIPNRIAYLLIVAAGAALRLKYLNTPMAYDEAYSFTNFARRPLLEALADYNNTNNHLLNTLFMHVMYRLFGQQEWALRLPVVAAGILLIAVSFPWARARIGAAPALVATALVAASPMMIDYSVNARGYTFLTLFAVILDCCFLRLAWADAGSKRAATWIIVGLCVCLGFFTMPTFVHPLAGLVVWFLAEAAVARGSVRRRLAAVVLCLAVAGIAVAFTYAPAFVFRGTLALQNDFVRPLPFPQWSDEFPTAVWRGVERWIAGGVPSPVLFVLAWGGVVAWVRRTAQDRPSLGWGLLPITATLLVPLGMMALQRVAPPPRLFFFMAPWFYLLVGVGAGFGVGLIQRLGARVSGDSSMRLLAYGTMAAGVWWAFEHPILREPHQREVGVGSVPTALRRLASRLANGGAGARLYAPLPCDHPAIFYASKFSVPVQVNGAPRPGERLFLLARPNERPEQTLADVVVQQSAVAAEIGPWKEAAKFAELTLWEASRRFRQTDTMPASRPRPERPHDPSMLRRPLRNSRLRADGLGRQQPTRRV